MTVKMHNPGIHRAHAILLRLFCTRPSLYLSRYVAATLGKITNLKRHFREIWLMRVLYCFFFFQSRPVKTKKTVQNTARIMLVLRSLRNGQQLTVRNFVGFVMVST